MKSLIQSLTFLLLMSGSLDMTIVMAQASSDTTRYSFTGDTHLFIDGTSSLHDWTCDVPTATGGFTTTATDDGLFFAMEEGMVSINVADIECGKRVMNSKLQEALMGNGAETIDFVMDTAVVTPHGSNAFTMAISGQLTIAGTTRMVDLIAEGSLQNGVIHFEGSRSLLQSDFGVDPPTALLGRLKTGDEVTVRFVATAMSN
jgi:polyisoprenoid-binding protein YceI